MRGPPHLIPTPPGTAHAAPASCPTKPASTQQPRPCRAWGTRAEPVQKKQGCSCETGPDGSWGKTTGQVMRPPARSQCTFQMGPKALFPPPRPLRGVGGELPVLFTILPDVHLGAPVLTPISGAWITFIQVLAELWQPATAKSTPAKLTSGALGRDGEAYSPAPPHTHAHSPALVGAWPILLPGFWYKGSKPSWGWLSCGWGQGM